MSDSELSQVYKISTVQQQYTGDFKDLIRPLCTITTRNELVYLISRLPIFTEINDKTDINIFKEGILPLWEDINNINGGKFLIRVKKQVSQRLFERLIYFFILSNEVKDQTNCNIPRFLGNINGLVASIRGKQVILSIWMSQKDNIAESVTDIRKILNVDYDLVIEFKNNDESLKDSSSFRNSAIIGKEN